MKTILTNNYTYDIDEWGHYLSNDSLKNWEGLDKYYTISDGNRGINIFIINNYPILHNGEADPCLGCPNYGGPKDVFGHPVVGDSPCQWCQHYKWRITW